jgi:hypothetical protein
MKMRLSPEMPTEHDRQDALQRTSQLLQEGKGRAGFEKIDVTAGDSGYAACRWAQQSPVQDEAGRWIVW